MEDTSIAYRLYLECGRMINLHDWFVAFENILAKKEKRPNEIRKKIKFQQDDIDESNNLNIRARFLLSLSELKYLGFIKPTTRKTDHAVRLTWGKI